MNFGSVTKPVRDVQIFGDISAFFYAHRGICTGGYVVFAVCGGHELAVLSSQAQVQGRFWEIKRHFYAGYTAAPFAYVPDNSGIVRIRFWVNCKGQVGNYSVECYDLGYALGRVNANIVSHLMGLLVQLKDWIPATGENGVAVNSHKFFAFRIDGGKLVDILPK